MTILYPNLCYSEVCYKGLLGTTRERSGSEVECLTWDRRAAGSSLTLIIGLCPWARHIYPCLVLVQPRKTPSRRNWKIVDWDVKNQIKQTKLRDYTEYGISWVASLVASTKSSPSLHLPIGLNFLLFPVFESINAIQWDTHWTFSLIFCLTF